VEIGIKESAYEGDGGAQRDESKSDLVDGVSKLSEHAQNLKSKRRILQNSQVESSNAKLISPASQLVSKR